MAKKKTNVENKETVVNNINKELNLTTGQESNETKLISTEGVITNCLIVGEKEILNESNKIGNVSLIDLMFLEKACALLCKRYETSARIDDCNNRKFKEYKEYYEKIFSELEIRVLNACK